MFPDGRPAARQVRQWFRELVFNATCTELWSKDHVAAIGEGRHITDHGISIHPDQTHAANREADLRAIHGLAIDEILTPRR